jgi:hypothetical protein
VAFYKPINGAEMAAVERVTLALHSINRCHRVEAGMCIASVNEALDPTSEELHRGRADLHCQD